MSDNIPLATIAQIGEILKEDDVIENQPTNLAHQHYYTLIRYTANSVPLYTVMIKGKNQFDPIPIASINKVHTVLINDGLIPENTGITSSNTTNGFFYYVTYASSNVAAFSVSKGAGGEPARGTPVWSPPRFVPDIDEFTFIKK